MACSGRLELHHLISHGDARGNELITKLLKQNPPELTDWVCSGHNQSRWADSKRAQAILFRRKVEQFGRLWMVYVLDSLPWKVVRPEMRLDGLLSAK